MTARLTDDHDDHDHEHDRLGREGLLELLDAAALEAHRKVDSGRVRDAENEKVRQGWIRALGYVAGQYRQLERDRELEELAERVARLEREADVDVEVDL